MEPREKAQRRILEHVFVEMRNQDAKWGYDKTSMPLKHALGILVEEVGEVAKSVNEKSQPYETRMELYHVAAVACQWAMSLIEKDNE